jgi:hypothetical protein
MPKDTLGKSACAPAPPNSALPMALPAAEGFKKMPV